MISSKTLELRWTRVIEETKALHGHDSHDVLTSAALKSLVVATVTGRDCDENDAAGAAR